MYLMNSHDWQWDTCSRRDAMRKMVLSPRYLAYKLPVPGGVRREPMYCTHLPLPRR